jgi:hypothetical protein
MKTDILRYVHEQAHARKAQGGDRSVLKMLIGSIEQVLEIFGRNSLVTSVSPNPFNIHAKHNFNQQVAYKHDIDLMASQLGYLKAILSDLDEDIRKSDIGVTKEQIKLATKIDGRIKELEKLGKNEVEILMEMTSFMPGFKKLMDEAGQSGMDELCARFEGFYNYAIILENLARAIKDGEIEVP